MTTPTDTKRTGRALRALLFFALLLFISLLTPTQAMCAKRVGVVYSETSANQFYDKFAYSQLFMAMQHQAMMAGMPFDVLAENDLTTTNLLAYDALIIPSMEHAANEGAIATALQTASAHGVGIITSGILLTAATTQDLIGVEPANLSCNGTAATVRAGNSANPAMRDYTPGEVIREYASGQIWFDSYRPITGHNAAILAEIKVGSTLHQGVLATENVLSGGSGRNVHFANDQVMGDSNLVWSALQWVVYGNQTPVGLKMGRMKSFFVPRNDMDQSMYIDELPLTDIPLYDILADWRQKYDFIGSYYLNIGNNPNIGEETDWNISAPLYRDYIALGNEIGTHSWTHPDYTANLNASQLEYEFNQSKNEISSRLGIEVKGVAVPGNPETLAVDWQLNGYFEYLSGRSGIVGSGYPGAFGYLTPEYTMIYFSLNMSPDFTLVEWLGYSPTQAKQVWANEYADLLNHASQPIIHWLWHDYGPTIAASTYTISLYEDTIAMAYNAGSEFATLDDIQHRIRTLQTAALEVDETGPLTVAVGASEVGRFSLLISSDKQVSSVDNWYAYDEDQIFLAQGGGLFTIHLGDSPETSTHITALPMHATLLDLNGNGTELSFHFEGDGKVIVELNPAIAGDLDVQGADSTTLTGTTLEMMFSDFGQHTVHITQSTPNTPPVASPQTLSTDEDASLAVMLTATDSDGNPLTFQIVSAPQHGTLSGTAPDLTYTPATNFHGTDSFRFLANDGRADSALATISITVAPVNDAPVASGQAIVTTAGTAAAITLSATDVDTDALTYSITTGPTGGTLTGSGANRTYTPNPGFSGQDSFTFRANDGHLDSNEATVTLTVTRVNSLPVADDQALTIDEDLSLPITLTAADNDNDPLSYRVEAGTGPAHGTLNGTAPNLTYQPAINFHGTDSFRFVANDGLGDSNQATISITIASINDAPLASDQAVVTAMGAATAVTLVATDVDSDALTYAIANGPTGGTLTGTGANRTYTPNPGFSGPDSFTFQATDGELSSNLATVRITVSQQPTAQLEHGSVTVGATPVTVTLTNSYFNPVVVCTIQYQNNTTPVVTRISSVTATSFTVRLQNPSGSAVTAENVSYLVVEEGIWNVDGVKLEARTYLSTVTDHDRNWSGEAQSYGQSYSKPVIVGQVMSDNDPAWSVFWCHGSSRTSPPSASTLITGKTVAEDSDTTRANETIGYIVFEAGHGNIGGIEFEAALGPDTVRGMSNSPPFVYTFATPFTTAPQVAIASMAGVDGSNGGWAYIHGPTLATASTLSLVIDEDQIGDSERSHGSEQVGYVVFGGTPNAPPVAANQELGTAEETAIALTMTATDLEEDFLTFQVAPDSGPHNGTLSGTAPNVIYQPGLNFHGTDSFRFIANDGRSNSAEATITITVTPVNDAPQAEDLAVITAVDTATAITMTAADVDGDALTYAIISLPTHGNLTCSGPACSYTPDSGFSGSDSFTFQASDGQLNSNLATANITVSSQPTAHLEYGSVTVGATPVTVTLTNTYFSPVVVCTIQYRNNTTPVVTRISSVTATSFTVRLQNPSGSAVAAENVSYLVVEEGIWNVDGVKIEARTYLSTVTDHDRSWRGEAQSYGQSYSKPVVLGQVMSDNDPGWSVFWCRGNSVSAPPSAGALVTGKTVAEDSDTTRADETIGYIVFETGHGSINGVEFEAALGADTVRGVTNTAPSTYTFTAAFNTAPQVALAGMAGMDGTNGGWAYIHGPTLATASKLYLSIDEDQISDSERSHTTEQVGYVVFATASSR